MINSAVLLLIGGCVLSAIQLAAGIAIGLWLRRGDTVAARRGRHDLLNADRITKQLKELTDEVSCSVGEHQATLQQATDALSTECNGNEEEIAEFVVGVIGRVVRANCTLQTRLEMAERRLAEQAVEIESYISQSLTDPLTGLPNRREFNEKLEERMAGWNRRGEIFSLLMLDVDHFKKLNDRHGHVAGDLMLSTLGQALRGVLRRDDAVARYGGEEFAMILPGTPLHSATEAVPRICDAVNGATVEHRDSLLRVTVSGGLATVQKGEAATSLIDRADAALYAAKSAGRDRVYMHDGAACLPITGAERHDQPLDRSEPAGASAEMAEHIPSGPTDFDDVASDEEISAALVKSCEELREYMQQREQPELSTGKT